MTRVIDLSGKRLQDLDVAEIAYCHLTYTPSVTTRDFEVRSVLDQIETEMRQARGTNLTSNYVPMLAGFSILDQLGGCYADKAMAAHPAGGSAIHRALYFFAGWTPLSPQVKAIYALRNGMVHDASLTSQDQKTGQWYVFRYDRNLTAAIKMAVTPWDGAAATLGKDTTTVINPRLFTDEVSKVISNLRSLREDRPQDLGVLQSAQDILHKYLFWESGR